MCVCVWKKALSYILPCVGTVYLRCEVSKVRVGECVKALRPTSLDTPGLLFFVAGHERAEHDSLDREGRCPIPRATRPNTAWSWVWKQRQIFPNPVPEKLPTTLSLDSHSLTYTTRVSEWGGRKEEDRVIQQLKRDVLKYSKVLVRSQSRIPLRLW